METESNIENNKCDNRSKCDVHQLEETSNCPNEAKSNSNCLHGEHDLSKQIHNKNVIKHALRQQAKRRRKNTTIASGNATSLPRIIVKPIPVPLEETCTTSIHKTPTMREVLASIPGFSIKPRRRSSKKLSTAAQLEQTKEGCIDLETPDSILVNTNLRGLLNKYTFAVLPPLYQHKLIQLLPNVDRQVITNSPDSSIRLSTSGLNNEFFARACLDWQERLAEGEFTPENQQKLKSEADKERNRLDPWKLKHFEPIWGDRSVADSHCSISTVPNNARPPIKTTIKLRQNSASNKQKSTPLLKRVRTVGVVTRSCTTYKEEFFTNEFDSKKSSNFDEKPQQLTQENVCMNQESDSRLIEKINTPENSSSINEFDNKTKCSESDFSTENSSDSLQNTTNDETIISSKENTNILKISVKRRRSGSIESDHRSFKRKTPSPVNKTEEEEIKISTELLNINESDSIKSNVAVEVADKITIEDNDSYIKNDEYDTVTEIDNKGIEQNEDHLETPDLQNLIVEKCLDEFNNVDNEIELSLIIKSEESNTADQVINTVIQASAQTSDPTDDLKLNDIVKDYNIPIEFSTNIEHNDDKSSITIHTEDNVEDTEALQLTHCENIQTLDVNDTHENFQILPNSLILQQESLSLNKNCLQSENAECIEETAEKLEASVEESDLVFPPLNEDNFENVSSLPDEEDPNEDRFIDAENYVLEESGQMPITSSIKNDENRDETIQATLFGTSVTSGKY